MEERGSEDVKIGGHPVQFQNFLANLSIHGPGKGFRLYGFLARRIGRRDPGGTSEVVSFLCVPPESGRETPAGFYGIGGYPI